jgi:hypothetical protein
MDGKLMDSTKEQLSEVFIKQIESKRGSRDLIRLMRQ